MYCVIIFISSIGHCLRRELSLVSIIDVVVAAEIILLLLLLALAVAAVLWSVVLLQSEGQRFYCYKNNANDRSDMTMHMEM